MRTTKKYDFPKRNIRKLPFKMWAYLLKERAFRGLTIYKVFFNQWNINNSLNFLQINQYY